MIWRGTFLLALLLCLAACSRAVSENAVQKALAEHPEWVLDAMKDKKPELFALVVEGQKLYQEQQRQAQLREDMNHPLSPAVDPSRPILGPADAPVTVVVYSDFLCPYCAKGAVTLRQFVSKHAGTVRVVFKHFASDNLSRLAAAYFEAIGRQSVEKAFAFHDAVFAAQQEVEAKGEPVLKEKAEKAGADMARLKKDLKDKTLPGRIEADVAEARKFHIEGTPTFVVNGVAIRGAVPLTEFEAVLRLVTDGRAAEAPCPTCEKKAAGN